MDGRPPGLVVDSDAHGSVAKPMRVECAIARAGCGRGIAPELVRVLVHGAQPAQWLVGNVAGGVERGFSPLPGSADLEPVRDHRAVGGPAYGGHELAVGPGGGPLKLGVCFSYVLVAGPVRSG